MFTPGHSCGPAYFLDVLNDEDTESPDTDDDKEIENIEEDEEFTEKQILELINHHIGSNMSTVEPNGEKSSDSISSPSTAPESLMNSARNSKRIRGFATRKRSTRSRSKYLVNNNQRRENVWSRTPWVERFASDKDLPELIRASTRVTGERDEATSASRAAVDLELEDNESDVDVNSVSEEFSWASKDRWCGEKETFFRVSSGPTKVFDTVYASFRSFWDDSLLSHIMEETNRYAQGISNDMFRPCWYNTNTHELLVLFAFWIMLDVLKMPTVKSCFSNIPILRTNIFRTLFSQDRYWNIDRAFRFGNGSKDTYDPDNDMGYVLEQLNLKFKQNYFLHQEICVDESLTIWKGPDNLKTRSTRLEIKICHLRESSTGYVWSFSVHPCNGASNSQPSPVSALVELMRPVLSLGHVVYMSNLVNSPKLARYLKSKNTDCVGMLRPNCKHLPAVIQAPLADGEFVARQSGDVMVVSLQDRGRVNYISTFHDLTQVEKSSVSGRCSQHKLKLCDDYHRGICGADRMDHMLEPYLLEGKQRGKWTKAIFKRLLNITIQNARIIFEQSAKCKIDPIAFRMSLVQFIMDRHLRKVPSASPLQQQNSPRTPSPPLLPCSPQPTSYPQFPEDRLLERHFVRRIPVTEVMLASIQHRTNLGRRQCAWCSANGRRRSKTVYECLKCNVPLCLEPCFEEFHTVP